MPAFFVTRPSRLGLQACLIPAWCQFKLRVFAHCFLWGRCIGRATQGESATHFLAIMSLDVKYSSKQAPLLSAVVAKFLGTVVKFSTVKGNDAAPVLNDSEAG